MKSQEIATKYEAYTALPANTPDAIKKDKESELAYLQENIQKFQQHAQTSMQKSKMIYESTIHKSGEGY